MEKMEISKYYITESFNTRRKELREETKYIVITSSSFPGFSARKNRNIIERIRFDFTHEFSVNYIIDTSGEILEIIPENEKAICTKNDEIDSKSISIMLCLDKDKKYTEIEIEKLSEFVINLCQKYKCLNYNILTEFSVNCKRKPYFFADENILFENLFKK